MGSGVIDRVNEETKTVVKLLAHNVRVTSYLAYLADAMKMRALIHDASKFSDDEFPGYVRVNRIAREHEYGSLEYMQSIKETGAIALHFAKNSHHPEHYPNGIDDMTLLDIIEMVTDWKAASETYGQTSLEDALVIHTERFGLRNEHLYLIRLVIEALRQGRR